MNSKTLCDEIFVAFRDLPRPHTCVPDDFIVYDKFDELLYQMPETWWDFAEDTVFLTTQSEILFEGTTTACFLYFLPGCMVGTVRLGSQTERIRDMVVAVLGADSGLSENLDFPETAEATDWRQFSSQTVRYISDNKIANLQLRARASRLQAQHERFQYLSDNLTLPQKRAVAHWLQFQLECDQRLHPEFCQSDVDSPCRVALNKWQQYA